MELMRLGYDPQFGVDYYFLSKAQGKKRILELESLDEQLSLLSGFSDNEQEQFLLYTLKTLNSMGSQVEVLVRAWISELEWKLFRNRWSWTPGRQQRNYRAHQEQRLCSRAALILWFPIALVYWLDCIWVIDTRHCLFVATVLYL